MINLKGQQYQVSNAVGSYEGGVLTLGDAAYVLDELKPGGPVRPIANDDPSYVRGVGTSEHTVINVDGPLGLRVTHQGGKFETKLSGDSKVTFGKVMEINVFD